MKKIILNVIFLSMIGAGIAQNQVIDAFNKSYAYEAEQDYMNALSAITKVYDATSYTLNLRLGWLYYLSGDYPKSQGYYKKAIALEPQSIEARLGYVYPASSMENWDDIIKIYLEILAIDPNNSLVNYRLAYIYNYRKEFTKAATFAQNVVALYPFDFNANYLLGTIYISQGKIKEAKIHLARALQYNPDAMEVKTALDRI